MFKLTKLLANIFVISSLSVGLICIARCAQAQPLVGAVQQANCGGSAVGCEFPTLFSNKAYLIVCRINPNDPNFPASKQVKLVISDTAIRVALGRRNSHASNPVTSGQIFNIGNSPKQYIFSVLAPSSQPANKPFTSNPTIVFYTPGGSLLPGSSDPSVQSVCYTRNVPMV